MATAVEWCEARAIENDCSAQVVYGDYGTGEVVWRLNRREARKRPNRRLDAVTARIEIDPA